MNPTRPIRRQIGLTKTPSNEVGNDFQPLALETLERGHSPQGVVEDNQQPLGQAIDGMGVLQIKRSISPDGRIDSISLEIDLSINPEDPDEIRTQAQDALALQTEIIREFLNGQEHADGAPKPRRQDIASLPQRSLPGEPARLLDIGVINGKWGPRYFINVGVANQVAKLWGTPKQIVRQLLSAGHMLPPEAVSDGLRLDLPCRATTQRSADGRFLNAIALHPAE